MPVRVRPKIHGIDWPEEIYQARRRSGLSRRELAARLGVSRDLVQSWELGRKLPRKFISELSAMMSLDDRRRILFRAYCAGLPTSKPRSSPAPRRAANIW